MCPESTRGSSSAFLETRRNIQTEQRRIVRMFVCARFYSDGIAGGILPYTAAEILVSATAQGTFNLYGVVIVHVGSSRSNGAIVSGSS
jgi:hypothetical protein